MPSSRARSRRPQSGRQEEIAAVGRKARAGGRGNGPVVPQRGVGAQGKGQGAIRGKGHGLAGAEIPGLGGQLSRRVNAGAITQDQALRTARQRQTFKAVFGDDWRTKVFGDRGYAQRTRTALAQNPDDPQVAALNKQLMERRQRLLQAAQERLAQGGSAQPRRRRRRPAAPQGGGY